MKITFFLTDDRGNEFEGSAILTPASTERKRRAPRTGPRRIKAAVDPSFDLNPLAFMKRYGAGLSGPEKFTLLLARLTAGDTSKDIAIAELRKQWNKMKSVMEGRFNPAYANRAKANGWVDTQKQGIYVLCASWKEALGKANG